jgi:hypothetical protein
MNPAEPPMMPRNLVEAAESEGRHQWLTTVLPAIIRQAQQMWSLAIGPPFQPGGQTAWVAPARDAADADLVLKVAWPHPEAAHEADGPGERLHADPRRLARRMAGLLDLDPDRMLAWLFARCVQESAEWPALAEVARTLAP